MRGCARRRPFTATGPCEIGPGSCCATPSRRACTRGRVAGDVGAGPARRHTDVGLRQTRRVVHALPVVATTRFCRCPDAREDRYLSVASGSAQRDLLFGARSCRVSQQAQMPLVVRGAPDPWRSLRRSPSRRAAGLPVPAGRPGNYIAASSCRFAQFRAQPIAIAKMCMATWFWVACRLMSGSVTYWTVLPCCKGTDA